MGERVLRTRASVRFEDRRAGYWYDNNMCPVIGPDGRAKWLAIFARDITQRKAMEQALATAKEQAERANLAKSRFLAAANHDLRQPLQAMTLLLHALFHIPLGEEAQVLAQDMRETLKIMEDLLNALLDISKLEAGTVIPTRGNFAVLPFLLSMRSQFRALAGDQGIRICLFPRKAVVNTDPALLARIVQNFLSNAIRHTRNGQILMGSRIRGERLRIEVWDRGEGIPNDPLERIFEEFYQLGNPARNRHRGLGLGLAIAKRVADLLDLRLSARSVSDKGSVFSVEIPLARGGPDQVAPEQRRTGQQRRDRLPVLVVDDDEKVLGATARLLELWGYRPLCAASAQEALDLVAAQEEIPRVAVVDYCLPGGRNGIELLAELRDMLGTEMPGILVSGDTAAEHLREAQSSGMPLLHKPVHVEQLRRLIERLLA